MRGHRPHVLVRHPTGAGDALSKIRTDAPIGDLVRAAGEAMTEFYPDVVQARGVGHSLGLTVHEEPSLLAGNETPLETNIVLAIEPGALARVTEAGYELLIPLDRSLIVVPVKELPV